VVQTVLHCRTLIVNTTTPYTLRCPATRHQFYSIQGLLIHTFHSNHEFIQYKILVYHTTILIVTHSLHIKNVDWAYVSNKYDTFSQTEHTNARILQQLTSHSGTKFLQTIEKAAWVWLWLTIDLDTIILPQDNLHSIVCFNRNMRAENSFQLILLPSRNLSLLVPQPTAPIDHTFEQHPLPTLIL
jgi:hypothetical protein